MTDASGTKELEKEFDELTKNVAPQHIEERIGDLNEIVVKAEKAGKKAKGKKAELKEKKKEEASKKPMSATDYALAAVSQMQASYAMSEDDADFYICTGHAGINYLASGAFWGPNAGIARRKLIEDYGPSGSMKSAFIYSKIANVQRIGGIGAVVDAEGARNMTFLKMLGVDLKGCINLVPVDKDGNECYAIENVFQIVREFIFKVRKGGFTGPIFIGIDSIAVCPLFDEYEQLLKGVDVSEDRGRRAKIVGQFQRCINGFLRSSDNTLDIVNQIRAAMPKPGSFGGPTETTTSGKSLEFYSDFRMDIRKKKSIGRASFKTKTAGDGNEDKNAWKARKLGNFFSATSEKTRATAPGKRIDDIEFYFAHGIAPLSGLFGLCLADEIIIQTSPGRYAWVDPKTRNDARLKLLDSVPGFTRRNFEESDWIFDNAELFGASRTDLEEFMKNSITPISATQDYERNPHKLSMELKEMAREKNGSIIIEDDEDEEEDEKLLGRKSKIKELEEKTGGKYKQPTLKDAAVYDEDEVPTQASTVELD